MTERDYGLEISTKAAELSQELIKHIQAAPDVSQIVKIGNEIRDIMAAARKEIEPQKYYYIIYRNEDDHYPELEADKYSNRQKAEKKIQELKKIGYLEAHFEEMLFDDYKEAN